ncbi:hypothetical protein FOXYSP1_09157 [Fusarium oxysporum f. sp. phaseoli]
MSLTENCSRACLFTEIEPWHISGSLCDIHTDQPFKCKLRSSYSMAPRRFQVEHLGTTVNTLD